MIILTINCGSSSLKYQLIDMEHEVVMAKGLAERIGSKGSLLKHTANGKSEEFEVNIPNHRIAVKLALDALTDKEHGVIPDLEAIDAVGHRVVHGGERFSDSVLITEDVLENIEACCEIAPVNNPPNVFGIKASTEFLPTKPQVAVFDTAFHQTMPKYAYLYGLPYELYEKYGIRRYGFHGTSHRYVAQVTAEMMNDHMTNLRIITCHLGNGASVTAVKYGKSVDTSMGFTPLDGLIMGTRSGEIDPAIIPFIMKKKNMTEQEVTDYLNKESGIKGISGLSSDLRDVDEAARHGDDRSQLAIDIFAYRVKKFIGSYVAVMGGADAITFTAGLGENSPFMRDKICNGLEYLGTRIDPKLNQCRGVAREISVPNARVKIFTVPTNEELMIARDTAQICRRLIGI